MSAMTTLDTEETGLARESDSLPDLSPASATDAPGEASPDLPAGSDHFFNRELSWIEFNRRVLEEALDESHPLLERLKFLAIFSTNLDEFFMIRVAGLKEDVDEEPMERSPDGMTAAEQLSEISRRLRPVLAQQMRCLREDVLPKLEAHGVAIVPHAQLTSAERRELSAWFLDNVFPVLTPQAVDPSHPFPYISNRSLNLGLMIEPADEPAGSAARFVRIKVPPTVPRLVPIGRSGTRFVLLGELITANASVLFPGMRVGRGHAFRVTRDADIEIMEDEAGDLLRTMEQQLRKRRFGEAVRLEVAGGMPTEMVAYLTESLELTPEDVYVVDEPLNPPDLMSLYDLPFPELKDKALSVHVPRLLANREDIFDSIRGQDILLHHPYTAYSTVTDFIEMAAADPDVLAIKMCLYRTGQRSRIVQALMDASERGKQVAVLVELKARFDEENNIGWARQLERAGVHVVYGVLGLKTHCKVALVVRREGGVLRRYVHLATGNYNPTTSRIYTDIGLFTCNPEIGADATDLFNFLTGYSQQSKYRRLVVAPVDLKERLLAMIERETINQRKGRPAGIVAKFNAITDTSLIEALYDASRAGVSIDLVVRGVCALRPGVPGLSENIRVVSIVGRFLEHSRIFHFTNGGEPEVWIGSADWMSRNLLRRVEVVTPILDPALGRQLKEGVLDIYLRDNVKARRLLPDGTYERVQPKEGEPVVDSQMYFPDHPV